MSFIIETGNNSSPIPNSAARVCQGGRVRFVSNNHIRLRTYGEGGDVYITADIRSVPTLPTPPPTLPTPPPPPPTLPTPPPPPPTLPTPPPPPPTLPTPPPTLPTPPPPEAEFSINSDDNIVSVIVNNPDNLQYQYTSDGGINWTDPMGAEYEVPEGLYNDGVIQVRAVLDQLVSEPTRLGHIISPYALAEVILSCERRLGNVWGSYTYYISGSADIGSTVRLMQVRADGSEIIRAIREVGEYGKFTLRAGMSADVGSSFYLDMTRGDYYYRETVDIILPADVNYSIDPTTYRLRVQVMGDTEDYEYTTFPYQFDRNPVPQDGILDIPDGIYPRGIIRVVNNFAWWLPQVEYLNIYNLINPCRPIVTTYQYDSGTYTIHGMAVYNSTITLEVDGEIDSKTLVDNYWRFQISTSHPPGTEVTLIMQGNIDLWIKGITQYTLPPI